MLGRRGQEEAPIELLIGVTVLTFVLIIAFYTMNNACSYQFEHKMKASLGYFARELESVYQGSVGTSKTISVDFSPEGCSELRIDQIRLFSENSEVCRRMLGRDSCLALIVQLREKGARETPVKELVNIPSDFDIIYSPCVDGAGDSINMNTITSTNLDPTLGDYNNFDECGWTTGVHRMKITKTASNKIEIT